MSHFAASLPLGQIKITRPENRTINAAGSKVETQSKQNVQNQKSKDFAL